MTRRRRRRRWWPRSKFECPLCGKQFMWVAATNDHLTRCTGRDQ